MNQAFHSDYGMNKSVLREAFGRRHGHHATGKSPMGRLVWDVYRQVRRSMVGQHLGPKGVALEIPVLRT